jgi:flagellar protein FliO/FliZ
MNATSAMGSIAALVGVIVLIPLVLWLLKRTPLGGGAARGPMRMVGTLVLGPTQRLVTVEVGSGDERRWLVLSVAPSGVTTLHTMAPTADAGAEVEDVEGTARRQPNAGASDAKKASHDIPMPAFARMLVAQQRVIAAAGKHAR